MPQAAAGDDHGGWDWGWDGRLHDAHDNAWDDNDCYGNARGVGA